MDFSRSCRRILIPIFMLPVEPKTSAALDSLVTTIDTKQSEELAALFLPLTILTIFNGHS